MVEVDVLVIGGGGAGMRAALEAVTAGDLSVALLSKTSPLRSTTGCTGGGINALLPDNGFGDDLEKYARDTMAGSAFLADPGAVSFFVERTAEAIAELSDYGVPFLRNADGLISQRKGGGASFPRICVTHGHSIAHMLYEQLRRTRVKELFGFCLLELVVQDGVVCGVVAVDTNTGKIVPVAAKAVIVATGGYGRIFWNRTTTPIGCTGDGIAACLKAGIAFKDPEFVQFHPTALAESGILISEAARSAGGHLFNANGERFMSRYAPEAMEMATRDLVSFAIEKEISEGRGFGQGSHAHVLLDLRHLGEKKIREKLAQVYRTALTFAGIDPVTEPIPIRPGCHFAMGGIDVVDYRTGATEVSGVFAAGECACVSIHGANRLGGNALAEILVFGKAVGAAAANYAGAAVSVDRETVSKAADRLCQQNKGTMEQASFKSLVDIRNRLAATMSDKAGIIRNGTLLQEALQELHTLQDEYAAVERTPSVIHSIEVGNMLVVAEAVVRGALQRCESRGGHCREDYPETKAQYAAHSIVREKQGVWSVEYAQHHV